MALDSDNVLSTLVDILKVNTATIALSLTSSEQIHGVLQGNPDELPIEVTQYPSVVVHLARETEKFDQIGQRNNLHELEFHIWPLIYTTESGVKAEQDMRKMAQNVKAVLKSNITLSNTALWSLPMTVDYETQFKGTYQKGARITFMTYHKST